MHFTYRARAAGSDLEQGDVLLRIGEFKAHLEEFHRYYGEHPEYEHLIVLTQSCDLVRREGSCKSEYISVAAIRPLQTLLERRLEPHRRSRTERPGCYASENAHRIMEEFTEKLLNNNAPGYFFLREDPDFGLVTASVAFLKLSIAIKSSVAYDRCLAARLGGLKEEFQAKLGWLVGNLYARPATRDWVQPPECTDADFEAVREAYLRRLGLTWVPDRDMEKVSKICKSIARERGVPVDAEIGAEAAKRVVTERDAKYEKLAARAAAVLAGLGILRNDGDRELYERRLASDEQFKALL